jgi:hypothetical protein
MWIELESLFADNKGVDMDSFNQETDTSATTTTPVELKRPRLLPAAAAVEVEEPAVEEEPADV